MPRTGLAYEKPSRLSQGLVVCLSVAVVLMAGWLAMTIMLANYATTAAVGDVNMANAPVHVEKVSPEPERLQAAPRANSAYVEPLPRDYASTTPTPSRSAPPPAPFAEPRTAVTRDLGYAPSSIATAAPWVQHSSIPALTSYLPPRAPSPPAGGGTPGRGQLADGREAAAPSIDAAEAIADLMRLPPPPSPDPPPRGAAGKAGGGAHARTRPRPRLESEDIQPVAQDQPSSDFPVDRRR